MKKSKGISQKRLLKSSSKKGLTSKEYYQYMAFRNKRRNGSAIELEKERQIDPPLLKNRKRFMSFRQSQSQEKTKLALRKGSYTNKSIEKRVKIGIKVGKRKRSLSKQNKVLTNTKVDQLCVLRNELKTLSNGIKKNVFLGNKRIIKNFYCMVLEKYKKDCKNEKNKANKKEGVSVERKRKVKEKLNEFLKHNSTRQIANRKTANEIKRRDRLGRLEQSINMIINPIKHNNMNNKSCQKVPCENIEQFRILIDEFSNKDIKETKDGKIQLNKLFIYLKEKEFNTNAIHPNLYQYIALYAENNQKLLVYNHLRAHLSAKGISYKSMVSKALYNLASQSKLSISFLTNFLPNSMILDDIIESLSFPNNPKSISEKMTDELYNLKENNKLVNRHKKHSKLIKQLN